MSVLTSANAAQAVGEYLQSPDDLIKVANFRQKLEKEKTSIDLKLKGGVKDQLDTTRAGLKKLSGTREQVQAIKDEMARVDAACKDPQYEIKTFDQISRVSTVHRNFAQVEEMISNLREVARRIEDLRDMLEYDQRDITGPAKYLFPVHHQLHQLEEFRNQTLHQAKKASENSRAILQRLFEPLDRLIQEFDQHFLTLCRNILPIIRAGHPEVIVKLCKISELEGTADQKAILIKLVKKSANLDTAAKFRSLQADARQYKHYHSNMMKAITESIRQTFEEEYAKEKDNPAAFLDNLGPWLFKDIIQIEEEVVPCFPPDTDIYSFFIKEYHKAQYEILKRLVADEPEAKVLLQLRAWVKEYKKSMNELNVPPELLDPPLLDGKEQSLIDDYLGLLVKKLEEWTANLMKTELNQFWEREEPPEVDADGLYGMQGAVIMFQMINQQADSAAESNQGAVLAQVIEASGRVMRDTQVQWIKAIESEYKKQVERPEEVKTGLVEYVIAIANDQIKCADYAEALAARLESMVSEKYGSVISEQLNAAIDGYLDVAKKCTQTLIDLIFNDLKPATKQLFGPNWYDGQITGQIIETMRDYMGDYQTYLNPSILELLVEDLLDTFLITYLTAMANANKLRIPAALDQIKEDVTKSFKFFSTWKQGSELEGYFEVVEMALGMLESSRSMVFLPFWSFAKKHGPCLAFVEGLMRAREDLDRSAVNEVMDSVKRKVKDENLQDPPEPTIMKKVIVQGTFARLINTATNIATKQS
ncbi:hypothetical protein M422DRAFT_151883 [Sphaerobolus stellatus SS14]|nr:hypothetical protein M422DRAFT_151883 [Sphaerobolus stellatus SS14]